MRRLLATFTAILALAGAGLWLGAPSYAASAPGSSAATAVPVAGLVRSGGHVRCGGYTGTHRNIVPVRNPVRASCQPGHGRTARVGNEPPRICPVRNRGGTDHHSPRRLCLATPPRKQNRGLGGAEDGLRNKAQHSPADNWLHFLLGVGMIGPARCCPATPGESTVPPRTINQQTFCGGAAGAILIPSVL
jgi:hypothetical protein